LLEGKEVVLSEENVAEFESLGVQVKPVENKPKKKTRQGKSKRTKYGTKASTKYYKKKYRGQG